ncbi:reverse transcriptase-like protein [Alkalihalobacillus hemicellulosilyticus]|uniref:RNase H type-1 domain-containing protein n=1 Tax=Halalkalibacter hemicellulosilyticusJCM 9152 TaxID=1236971 RepID=W4QFQ0_9BACI|nr:reverse transcriptase-like protein [Halalkalibacter hemicellulosilyticus]GAE30901.1 hypothetical protein JCM9152_2331 [Halalkalibacter hemicellulosilyticusJCM 9152]
MNVKIEWTYRMKKKKNHYMMTSEWLTIQDAYHLIIDLEQSGRMVSYTAIDQYDTSWTIKDFKKYLQQERTMPHNVQVFIDGGFDPHTKEAGIGWVIYYKQHGSSWRHRQNDRLDLLEDNNEAEYAALYRCLQTCELLTVTNQAIVIYSDSLTVVKQASGEWPCYEEHFRQWLDRIDELAKQLGVQIEYALIDRSKNKEAHKLATQALNDTLIESKQEQT